MDLMKMNFVEKSEEYTIGMFNQLKVLAQELTDEQLKEMLNDSWRPSKVGAWMIGIGNRVNLKKDLKIYLLETPSDYSEHALMNYYILAKEESEQKLFDFIERQVKYYLAQKEYVEFDNLSIHWAWAILNLIDENQNRSNINQIESTDWWKDFKNYIKNTRYYDLIGSNYFIETVKEVSKRIEKDDNKI